MEVNRNAFVSLIRVKLVEKSVRNFSSRHSAVRMPANPPPKTTMRFLTETSGSWGANSGPKERSAMSSKACFMTPSEAPYTTQPTKAGKCWRICSSVHSGHLAGEQRDRYHADE